MIARAAAFAIVALLVAGCSTADATPTSNDPNITCRFTHPSKSADSLKRLPAPVRAYIKAKVGSIADRGAFFNSGDVVTRPAPFNRYIRGGKLGEGYFLWYEHGGFAY